MRARSKRAGGGVKDRLSAIEDGMSALAGMAAAMQEKLDKVLEHVAKEERR